MTDDALDAIPFDTTYLGLPERLYERRAPTPVRAPRLLRLNVPLAAQLGLDAAHLVSDAGVAFLAGNRIPARAASVALGYAGHQFGHFVPQLGDGRAILVGELVDRDGARWDLQWKGSGRTAYSRGGDGRAALGPVVREHLVSEAMHALGVPTTRALAAMGTGETVVRERPYPGAVLVRVARSHLRVGTLQFAAARGDDEALRALARYALVRHFPASAVNLDDDAEVALALLRGVIERQASLVARWMCVGFIHGVMNTDNTSISGDTIDYGPCAFMDAFHPGTVFSSIDRQGRYAWGNQARIAAWNLARLAEALLPLLLSPDESNENEAVGRAQGVLATFGPAFDAAYLQGLRAKLGLHVAQDGDAALAEALFDHMARAAADFTNSFRALCGAAEGACGGTEAFAAQFGATDVSDWVARWQARIDAEGGPSPGRAAAMRAVNPAFIPRNHQVEAVIQAALQGDLAQFDTLLEVLSRPYEDQPAHARFTQPPRDDERVLQTFCGT